jgi:hypothetical protein
MVPYQVEGRVKKLKEEYGEVILFNILDYDEEDELAIAARPLFI